MTIRVGIVDDQQLVRAGFSLVINSQPDMEVVIEAGDGVQALRAPDTLRPHRPSPAPGFAMTPTTALAPRLSFAIMGAGAVGCYFGALLAQAGHTVRLVARPTHVQAITAHGFAALALTPSHAWVAPAGGRQPGLASA